MTTEDITKSIVDRTKGIVDKNCADKVYKASGIKFDENGQIFLVESPEKALESLVKNLESEGGAIVKIMLRNLAHEKGMNFLER